MPTYTYVCQSCGKKMILNRPIVMRDDPMVDCTCGGTIYRVPDAPDFSVRGGTPKFHEKGRT